MLCGGARDFFFSWIFAKFWGAFFPYHCSSAIIYSICGQKWVNLHFLGQRFNRGWERLYLIFLCVVALYVDSLKKWQHRRELAMNRVSSSDRFRSLCPSFFFKKKVVRCYWCICFDGWCFWKWDAVVLLFESWMKSYLGTQFACMKEKMWKRRCVREITMQ